jgi:hypothetical protein
MNNLQKLVDLHKDQPTKSLEVLITKLQNDKFNEDVKVDRIIEAMNQGAVEVADLDPFNNVGDLVMIRLQDQTLHYIDLGSYETTDEGKFYSIDSYEDLEAEVLEEIIERIEYDD